MAYSIEEQEILEAAQAIQKREKSEKVNRKQREAEAVVSGVKGTIAYIREWMGADVITPGAKFTIECRQYAEGLEIIAKRITVKDRGAAIYITADNAVTDKEGFETA